MSLALGKRKRGSEELPRFQRSSSPTPSDHIDDDADIHDIFRRHFEARFRPLDIQSHTQDAQHSSLETEDNESSDWTGLSDSEPAAVEVVDYEPRPDLGASHHEIQAYMSSKPPLSNTVSSRKDKCPLVLDDGDEARNLKNDLALQRLLSESHLLDSPSSLSVAGPNRHKVTDLRIQSLGAKDSAFKQGKMPIAMRKGIAAKAKSKEEKRRREARENGIILEKAMKAKKKSGRNRDRGVGGPSIGKFSGGTLRLSRRDVESITGPKKGIGGVKGRKR